MTTDHSSDACYDLLVIGGGINGAGIACDAAARGLRVALLESDDFGSGTSSRSTKLIHGGLRYLEYFDFRLVRESLAERERLMAKAGHIAWPLRFVMPVVPGAKPAWLVRIGLFLYDHLAKRVTLPGTETVQLGRVADRLGFSPQFDKAFIYSDCWVDDARLVIANVQGAQEQGADIFARTEFESAEREAAGWRVAALDRDKGDKLSLFARVVVNAAGPWAVPIAESVPGVTTAYQARLIRGSHIVVPRLYDGDHSTMLQVGDGRIVVTMPYEEDYTLVGTTDQDHHQDPRHVSIATSERDYLLAVANRFFARQTGPEDIRWTYSGVRPLFEEGTSRDRNPTTVSRDYSFKIDTGLDGKGAPFLTVLGGKLTTYRRLADHALDKLRPYLPAGTGVGNSDTYKLPGANIGVHGPLAFAARLAEEWPWLPKRLCYRYARTYGDRVPALLGSAKSISDLGRHFGGDLYAREVDYLATYEWARCSEDVVWRRTKCGLRMSADEITLVDNYMGEN